MKLPVGLINSIGREIKPEQYKWDIELVSYFVILEKNYFQKENIGKGFRIYYFHIKEKQTQT